MTPEQKRTLPFFDVNRAIRLNDGNWDEELTWELVQYFRMRERHDRLDKRNRAIVEEAYREWAKTPFREKVLNTTVNLLLS
jgi:hypothetical protein